jgi:hypothetical protein
MNCRNSNRLQKLFAECIDNSRKVRWVTMEIYSYDTSIKKTLWLPDIFEIVLLLPGDLKTQLFKQHA